MRPSLFSLATLTHKIQHVLPYLVDNALKMLLAVSDTLFFGVVSGPMRSGESSIFKVDKVIHAPCVRSRKTMTANVLQSCSGISGVAVEVCLYSWRCSARRTVSEHS